MEKENFNFLNGTKIAEFHLLKLYPSAALNRDDSGEQKTAYYNGYLRNRISSQCLKRAYRTSETFKENFIENGVRTKRMPEYVGEKLADLGVSQDLVNAFKILLSGKTTKGGDKSAKKVDNSNKAEDELKTEEFIEEGKPVKSKAIAFYSSSEINAITDVCFEIYKNLEEPKAKSIKKIKLDEVTKKVQSVSHPVTVDIAAFGRMVTDNMLKPLEAAMQFSQVLSTNSAIKENDYFVACDDLAKKDCFDDAGSEMLGDIDYASACYYIHAVADLEQFTVNLANCENYEELVKSLPSKFVDVMAYTDPSARQNTFEAHVLPEVIYVELKNKKRPLNRMKAFSTPCYRDILNSSVQKLAENISTVSETADLGVVNAVWYCENKNIEIKLPKDVKIAKSIMELEKIVNEWMKVDEN